MIDWSIDKLRQIRKESQKNIHIIDVINGSVYDYEPIFNTEAEAKQKIKNDVESLIKETYDHFDSSINLDRGIILCAFYHKKKNDIIGTIALYHFSQHNVEYIELGLSLISKKYQKMGFQSVEARRIREYAYYFLRQGFPFYISARMASATTQLQVQRGQLPEASGKIVNVAYPKGFVPFYIANKNDKGNFMLEFGLFYDAWPTLNQIVMKDVHLPSNIDSFNYQILNIDYRNDINPIFHDIDIKSNGHIHFDGHDYTWEELNKHARIFGNLKSSKEITSSGNGTFEYSTYSNPDEDHLVIAIENVKKINFIKDLFNPKFKSICCTVQVSDFSSSNSLVANLSLIKILVDDGFFPTCIYDILLDHKRIRLCLFARWQYIAMQDYFEFLHYYHQEFKVFWHDVSVAQLSWDPKIEIMTDEKIEGKILVERFKSIL